MSFLDMLRTWLYHGHNFLCCDSWDESKDAGVMDANFAEGDDDETPSPSGVSHEFDVVLMHDHRMQLGLVIERTAEGLTRVVGALEEHTSIGLWNREHPGRVVEKNDIIVSVKTLPGIYGKLKEKEDEDSSYLHLRIQKTLPSTVTHSM